MSTSLEVAALSIGARAYFACQQSRLARVIGVTSRGLFLLAPQQIIFVSFERYRSPLTINLARSFDRLRAIEMGALARLSESRLIFPTIAFSVTLSTDVVWHCPAPVWASLLRAEQMQLLQAIATEVLTQAGGTGWSVLLPRLIDLPGAAPLSNEHAALFDRLNGMRRAVQRGDSQQLLDGLTSLLGRGAGLTPSGDDAVIGLLLMLARFSQANARSTVKNMLQHVAIPIVAEAYQRTTALSANLIECAVDGQGDERLIDLADGLVTGSIAIDDCVAGALGWGSSSGIDALVGMAVAVTAL